MGSLGVYLSAYLYILTLVTVSFRGSSFALSKRTVALHFVLSATVSVLSCVSIYLQWADNENNLVHISAALTATHLLLYTVGLSHLGLLQTRNLMRLIALNDNTKAAMSKLQLRLLQTATKVSVLLGVSAVSFVFYGAFIVLTSTFVSNERHRKLIGLCAYIIASIAVTLCIYLAFQCNEQRYEALCHWCDVRCSRMCHRIAGKGTPNERVLAEMIDAVSSPVSTEETVSTQVTQPADPGKDVSRHPAAVHVDSN